MLAYKWRELYNGLENIMNQINRDLLKKNIEEGRAVKIYDYDARFANLNANQLADIFHRSGITLDKDTIPVEGLKAIGDDIWRMPRFAVCGDTARLMDKNEPMPDITMLESINNLSHLLASQIKGTVHTSEPKFNEYQMEVMIHPDPQTTEQVEQFTLSRPLDSTQYYRMASESFDMTYLLASKYSDDLYRTAIDAYEHSFQKKIDDVKQLQAVSEISIKRRIDGNTYISCHVYGEKQLSKRMRPTDVEYYRMRMAASDKAYNGVAPELAQKYFKSEIESASQQQEQSKGMKR